MTKDLKKTTSQRTDLATLLKTDNFPTRPSEAFYDGTSLQAAVKEYPSLVRGWMLAEVGKLCKDMDMSKTLKSDEEIQFCCRSIIEDHPTVTLQEMRLCFNMVRQGKFGKLYERLKTAEILDCLRNYESEIRTQVIEDRISKQRSEMFERSERKLEPLNLKDLVKDSPLPTPQGGGTRIRQSWEKNNHTK
jgi:hypothetical protein